MLLFAHRWRDESRSLLSWTLTVGLVTAGALLLSIVLGDLKELARAFQGWLAEAPPIVRAMIGGELSLFKPGGFVLGTALNTFIPILTMVYVTSAVANIYALEASQGTLEFLFSLPMKRLHLIGGRLLVFLANLATIHAVIYLAAVAGLLVIGESFDFVGLAWAVCNQYLLSVFIGSSVLLISLMAGDYNRTQFIALGIFLGLFLLKIMQEEPKGLALLNPYSFYQGAKILYNGHVPWRDLAILAGSALLFWTGGICVYRSKQI